MDMPLGTVYTGPSTAVFEPLEIDAHAEKATAIDTLHWAIASGVWFIVGTAYVCTPAVVIAIWRWLI